MRTHNAVYHGESNGQLLDWAVRARMEMMIESKNSAKGAPGEQNKWTQATIDRHAAMLVCRCCYFCSLSIFVSAQAILSPAVSFGICDVPYLHEMQFALNEHCLATSSQRVRTSTVPHMFIDSQTHVAEELAGDSPLALLIDGTTRKTYKLEAVMGRQFQAVFIRQPDCSST